jgi:hypothetical protein
MTRHNASLAAQTSRDFEHRLLVDGERKGVGASHVALRSVVFDGEYVVCVDDDEALAASSVVARVIAELKAKKPPLAFVRVDHRELGFLPSPWGGLVRCGTIGAEDFIIRRDVWEECKWAWGDRYEGDWDFIEEVLKHYQPLWIDVLWGQCLTISHGQAEDEIADAVLPPRLKKKVQIVIGCAGLWGAASEGETVELDVNIAESLLRGGLALDPETPPEQLKKSRRPKSKAGNAS